MPRATRKTRRSYGRKRATKRKQVATKTRKRTSAKRTSAKRKKATARRKRMDKTLSRVKTLLKDETVSIRKMCPVRIIPDNEVDADGEAFGQPPIMLDYRQDISDGQYVQTSPGHPKKYQHFFKVDKFHGGCIPRRNIHGDVDSFEDPLWEKHYGISGVLNGDSIYLQQDRLGGAEEGQDIRAFRQIELPFMPCIPMSPHQDVTAGNYQVSRSEIENFARKGDHIRIKSNYFRFNFFVRAEKKKKVFSSGQAYADTTNVVAPPISTGAIHESGNISGREGVEVSYQLSAPRYAKARIIVVSREDDDNEPIVIDEFLKEADPYIMGDEEYRMKKYFNRGYKTGSDVYENLQTTEDNNNEHLNWDIHERSEKVQIAKQNVQKVYDKTFNLKMNDETVVTLNLLKGKTLKYREQHNSDYFAQDGVANGQVVQEPFLLNFDRGVNVLPSSPNELLYQTKQSLLALANDPALAQDESINNQKMVHEMVPLGKKYAMFMLLMNQRCKTEYQVFSKFTYDK